MEIRLATSNDIPGIMEFIKNNWNENHILANSVEFMKYQHLSADGRFTYVIAEENNTIYGIEGYILLNHKENPDIAGALWKVIPNKYFMLGKQIRDRLMQLTNCRYMCSPGINMNTSGRVLGMYGQTVEKMEHYYRLNANIEYKIAKVQQENIIHTKEEARILKQIVKFDEIDNALSESYLQTKTPYKDKEYLKHRYFEHPVYQYKIYQIDQFSEISFVVIREVETCFGKIAKIIDFVGCDAELIGLEAEWDRLMQENKWEYIDLYCYGIEDNILKRSGFLKRTENDPNIIPNYFEPFEQKNVDIYFVSNVMENLHLYRGDGDQDRPSKWK